jgi:subtilisin
MTAAGRESRCGEQETLKGKKGRRNKMGDKPEQPNASQPHSPGASRSGSTRGGAAGLPGKVLTSQKRQYLIASRRTDGFTPVVGFQPAALEFVEQALRNSPDVEIVDNIGPKGLVGTLADGLAGMPNVIVARMADDKAEILRQQSRGYLIVEPDQPLHLDQSEAAQPAMVTATAATGGPEVEVAITVLGKDSNPVEDAEVYLFGSVFTARGTTDERGRVTLSLEGDTPESVRGLYVKPKSDYWTFYQPQPALDTGQPNVVVLRPLSDSFPDFPRRQTMGWGQKAMRLDQLPANYRGQGARVAILDSGIAPTHQNLRAIRFGFDVINKKTDPNSWNRDTVAHGSHCAGIIAGADDGFGIRGFAPEAEVHICKLFPGGHISQLIDALEYCIEKQIDIVNLNLGENERSEALEQQILRAKRLGVACIAAAGNSGAAVEYPASSPNVLAVAAIGRLGEFPPDSYHAQTVGVADANGFFSPKFSCFGPEIAVCAPGVAILSSVPPNNYAVWDGTSMAAAHVAGLAALILVHHPDFQGRFKMRNADRVDRLFQIIKSSTRPVNLGDPRRTGFGVPDVLAALGLAPRPVGIGMAPYVGPQSWLDYAAQIGALGRLGMSASALYGGYSGFGFPSVPYPVSSGW